MVDSRDRRAAGGYLIEPYARAPGGLSDRAFDVRDRFAKARAQGVRRAACAFADHAAEGVSDDGVSLCPPSVYAEKIPFFYGHGSPVRQS